MTIKFGDYLSLSYPPELRMMDTTESSNSTSNLLYKLDQFTNKMD